MSPRAMLRTVAAATTIALTLAGCGGSSSGSSATVKITGSTPSGASAYQGSGYSVAVPPGWRKVTAGNPGHELTGWYPASNQTSAHLYVETLTGNFRYSAKTAYSELRANGASSVPKATSITMSRASVPGATSATAFTEKAPSKTGPVLVKLLLVDAKSGTEYLVTSGSYGSRSFDPLPYLESFKLSSGS